MSLPSPLLNQIIKNSSSKIQIKISQTSKPMNILVQKIRRYQFDLLHIVSHMNTKMQWHFNKIELYLNFKDVTVFDKKITFKNLLRFRKLKINDFGLIHEKVDLSNLKRLEFYDCVINESIFQWFYEIPVLELFLTKNNILGFDVFCCALKNMKKLISICFEWQTGITSFEEAAKIQRDVKLKNCDIRDIDTILCPKVIAKFAENNIMIDADNGILQLLFSLQISRSYIKEIEKEVPKNLHIIIIDDSLDDMEFGNYC